MRDIIVGIDEVGRGALAGPLVSAAVVLPIAFNTELFDSKTINVAKRESLAKEINNSAEYVGLGWVSNNEIDEFGLSWALRESYLRAIKTLSINDYKIILDGSVNYLTDYNCEAIIKADGSVACVSAASIVAKVARDKYMYGVAKDYKEYGYDTNVGYGIAKHREAILNHGLSDLHRKSFCSKIIV